MTAATGSGRLPVWLVPLTFAVLLAAAITAVIILAGRAAAPDVPSEPGAFESPAPARPVVVLDVQQVTNGRLTLSDGSRDLALDPNVRVEALRAETADGIRAGDWLTVVGVSNEVRTFSIRALVLFSAGGAVDAEGIFRSPAGFAGHETALDQIERPLLGGIVERVEADHVVFTGPSGPVTVRLTPGAPLLRLMPAQPSDIREGDRIAYHTSGGERLSDAAAVLLWPGGAR